MREREYNIYKRTCSEQVKTESTKKSPLRTIIIIGISVLLVFILISAVLYRLMMGYTSNSRRSSANSIAASLCKSVNAALTEMKDNGYSVEGYYLVCSDRNKNINIPENFDEDLFYQTVESFFNNSDKIQWYAVVENDWAVYAAGAENWKRSIAGTYPASGSDYLYYYNTGSVQTKKRDKVTLNKLYDVTANKVREKATDEDFLREIMTSEETKKE